MTYIVTGDCVDCVYTSCVDECPVAAFHDAEDKLLINPDTCIDCDACVAACPVEAIHADHDVPEGGYVHPNGKVVCQKFMILPYKWFYGGKEPADNPFLREAYEPAKP